MPVSGLDPINIDSCIVPSNASIRHVCNTDRGRAIKLSVARVGQIQQPLQRLLIKS